MIIISIAILVIIAIIIKIDKDNTRKDILFAIGIFIGGITTIKVSMTIANTSYSTIATIIGTIVSSWGIGLGFVVIKRIIVEKIRLSVAKQLLADVMFLNYIQTGKLPIDIIAVVTGLPCDNPIVLAIAETFVAIYDEELRGIIDADVIKEG